MRDGRTRTLQRSHAWPVRVELASFFLTEPEKSLFCGRCCVNGLAVPSCSVLGNLEAWWTSSIDALFGPMMGWTWEGIRRGRSRLHKPARLASRCNSGCNALSDKSHGRFPLRRTRPRGCASRASPESCCVAFLESRRREGRIGPKHGKTFSSCQVSLTLGRPMEASPSLCRNQSSRRLISYHQCHQSPPVQFLLIVPWRIVNCK